MYERQLYELGSGTHKSLMAGSNLGATGLQSGKRPGQLALTGPEGVSRLPFLLRRAELRFDRAYAGID